MGTKPRTGASGIDTASADAKGRDAVWPFIMIFIMMWGGMIGTTLNTDPIQSFGFMGGVGLVCALAIVAFLATARLRRWSLFTFPYFHFLANLAWHIFVLSGILFICYLTFDGLVQGLLLFGAPVFESGCDKISERDTALFVWDAMAKGAFKFLAGYLHIPAEACPPSRAGWTSTIAAQTIRWFTALVVVWYVIGFVRTWHARLRTARQDR
jgi:hypothetical protein